MKKNGVNRMFIREISERISRLKVNPSLADSEIMLKLDSNFRKLEQIDKNSGVPPPIDTSVQNTSLTDLNLSEDDLEGMRRANEAIKADVLSHLEQFKSAKADLLTTEFETLNEPNYSELMHLKDLENQFLKSKISDIESALKSKKEEQCVVCRCITF